MLIRIVPAAAILIMLIALLTSSFWRPHHQDGLSAPAHSYTQAFWLN